MDAASRTRVEDTRELLENVPYAPTQGRFKIYLIDEVHMLSTHSFNALLKTLEEPPPHVKFLLATTDPQKLPITVVSRCLHLQLKPLLIEEIAEHIQNVLKSESVDYDESGVVEIAKAAQGSLRDALTITEQALAFGEGALNFNGVRQLLGLSDPSDTLQLVEATMKGQADISFELANRLLQQSGDAKQILCQLLQLVHDIGKAQALGMSTFKMVFPEQLAPQFASIVKASSPEFVQISYQALIQSLSDLPYTPNPAMVLEGAILKMLYFAPQVSYSEVPLSDHSSPTGTKLEAAQNQPTATDNSEGLQADLLEKKKTDSAEITSYVADHSRCKSSEAAPLKSEPLSSSPFRSTSSECPPSEVKLSEEKPAEAENSVAEFMEIGEWVSKLQAVEKSGGLPGSVAHLLYSVRFPNNRIDRRSEGHLSLMLAPADQCMMTEQLKTRIERHVKEILRINSKIEWVYTDSENLSARDYVRQKMLDNRDRGIKQLQSYPLTQALMTDLNAEIVPESVSIAAESG